MAPSVLNEAEVQSLAASAVDAMRNAYCPYSKFPVGAALLAEDGRIFQGVNVENASYPVTICAERSAIVSAVSQGVRKFRGCAVATELPRGGAPCGMCRQMLAEFGDYPVLFVSADRKIHVTTSTLELLPHAFTPASLEEHKNISKI